MDPTSAGRPGSLCLLVACLGLTLPCPAAGATITATWLGGAGAWSDGARWSSSPDSPNNAGPVTYDAMLPVGSEVTVDEPVTIERLALDGSLAVNQNLTLNDVFRTNGILSGTATLFANGGIDFRFNSTFVASLRLVNAATAAFAGSVILSDGATLSNAVGGTLLMDSSTAPIGDVRILAPFPGPPSTVVNRGSILARGITATIDAPLQNSGSVAVTSGQLSLRLDGAQAGSFSAASGSTLVLSEGSIGAGASVTGAGTVSAINLLVDGDWTVSGTTQVGNVEFRALESSTGALKLFGALALSGDLEVATDFDWISGTLTGPGRLGVDGEIAIGGAGQRVLDGRRLENRGLLSWAGGVDLRNGAALVNTAGGTVAASGDGLASFDLGGAPSRFENEGAFVWSGFGSIGPRFENRGMVSVTDGIMWLRGGGTASGRFEVSPNAELQFSAPPGTSHELAAGSSILGEGRVVFGGFGDLVPDGLINVMGDYAPAVTRVQGEATVNFPTLTGDFPGRLELTQNSTTRLLRPIRLVQPTIDGNLVVADELRLSGLAGWAGEISGTKTVQADGELRLGQFGRLRGMTFENSGNAVQGPVLALEDALFRNLAGATYEAASFDNNIFSSGAARFENLGTFRRRGEPTFSGSTFIETEFLNSGTLEVIGSSLEFGAAFRQIGGRTRLVPGRFTTQLRGRQGLDFEAGTLEGTGTILADVRNGATILPGEDDAFGGLEMNSLELLPTSEIVFEIGGRDPGTEFDVVEVRIGAATLGGDLVLELEAAHDELSAQDRFEILTARAGLLGGFQNVASGERLRTRDGLGEFLVGYGPGGVVLTDFRPLPAAAQAQTRDEQRCTNALNTGLAKVASARATAALRCIKERAKGGSAEACLDQPNRRLDAARVKTLKAPCDDVEPDFGTSRPELVNDAASGAFPELLEDVFGGDLDQSLATRDEDRDAVRCQGAVAAALKKCFDTRLATFNACAKKGLASGAIDSEPDLEQCVGADPRNRIDRACGFPKRIERSCKTVSLAETFPACGTSSPQALAACFDSAAECRACAAIRSGDAISGGCPACTPKPLVVVPPAADMAGTVEVTATPVDPSTLPPLPNRVGPVIDFGPDGYEFDDMVTVGIPIDRASARPGNAIALFNLNEDTDAWEELAGSTIQGPLVLAQTDRFSAVAPAQVSIVRCSNLYSGGAGPVAPIHVPGAIQVTPGVALRQEIVYSGSNAIALGSEWSVPGCVATVTGSFGPGAGSGAWIDYSNGGVIDAIPGNPVRPWALVLTHSTPADPVGPHLGLADPCYASLGMFQYWLTVHFAGNCVP